MVQVLRVAWRSGVAIRAPFPFLRGVQSARDLSSLPPFVRH